MPAPLVMDDSRSPDDACESRYRERLRARQWYRRALDRLVRAKRVYQGAVIDSFPHATARMGHAALSTTAAARQTIARAWLRWPIALTAWSWVVCVLLAWFRGGWWWQPAGLGLVAEAAVYWWRRADMHTICGHGYELGASLKTLQSFSRLVAGHTWRSELLRRMSNDSSAGGQWSRLPTAVGLEVVQSSNVLKLMRDMGIDV